MFETTSTPNEAVSTKQALGQNDKPTDSLPEQFFKKTNLTAVEAPTEKTTGSESDNVGKAHTSNDLPEQFFGKVANPEENSGEIENTNATASDSYPENTKITDSENTAVTEAEGAITDRELNQDLAELSGLPVDNIESIINVLPNEVQLSDVDGTPAIITPDGSKFLVTNKAIMWGLVFLDLATGARGLTLAVQKISSDVAENVLIRLGVDPKLVDEISNKYKAGFSAEMLELADPKNIESFLKKLIQENDHNKLGKFLRQLDDDVRLHFLNIRRSFRHGKIKPISESLSSEIAIVLQNTDYANLLI